MDNQAIRPSFYADFTTKVEEIKEETKADEDVQALSYITHFKGWQLIKEHVERLNRFLDESLQSAIANNASVSEIGERAMVRELSRYLVNSIIDKADNARRSTDK